MASNIYIPFNHRPSNIDFKNNASYTVPAGKYARVVVSYDVNVFFNDGSISGSASQNTQQCISNQTGSIEIWVNAGDVVSSSRTVASGAMSISPSSAGDVEFRNNFSRADITVNSNRVKRVSAYGVLATSGGTIGGISWAGSVDVDFHIEEYDIVS